MVSATLRKPAMFAPMTKLPGALKSLAGIFEDAGHDGVQLFVHFFKGPLLHAGVLGHFQLAGGHAACIGGLARAW